MIEPKSATRAKSIAEWAPPKAKAPKRPPETSKAARGRYAEEAERMRLEGDWAGLRAGHAVALYVALHERTYGVRPTELDHGREFAVAAFAVGRLLRGEFDGDVGRFLNYFGWAWHREGEREAWRRENGREGGRMGWRLCFSASLVSEHRVALERKRK